jgi:hypothetical protein
MSQRRSELLSRVQATTSQGAVASPGKSPANKRSSSTVLLALSQGKKLKTADDPESDGDTNSHVSTLPNGKRCLGCLRVSGVDKSYYVSNKPFAWLYTEGRGEWCKDCGNTYRLLYKNVMGLPTFANWLRDHRLQFQGNLLAVVSLRQEGINHVTTEKVEKRVELLTWCYGISGYPYPLAAVHVLAPSQDSVRAVRDGFVVPGPQPELYVLVPRPESQTSGQNTNQRFVTRTQQRIAWPLTPVSEASPSVQSWWATAEVSEHVSSASLQAPSTCTALALESGDHTGTSSTAAQSAGGGDRALAKYKAALDAHQARGPAEKSPPISRHC